MTEQDLVRNEVEKTLASMEGMERLDAGPAFFAKLQARLDAESSRPAAARRHGFFPVLLPRLRPVLLGLLILINILTVVFVTKAGRSGEGTKNASVMTVADDYSLDQDLDDFNLSGEEKGK